MKYKGLLEECVDTVFKGYLGQVSGLIWSGAQLDQALSPTSGGSLEDHKWYPFIQYRQLSNNSSIILYSLQGLKRGKPDYRDRRPDQADAYSNQHGKQTVENIEQ